MACLWMDKENYKGFAYLCHKDFLRAVGLNKTVSVQMDGERDRE